MRLLSSRSPERASPCPSRRSAHGRRRWRPGPASALPAVGGPSPRRAFASPGPGARPKGVATSVSRSASSSPMPISRPPCRWFPAAGRDRPGGHAASGRPTVSSGAGLRHFEQRCSPPARVRAGRAGRPGRAGPARPLAGRPDRPRLAAPAGKPPPSVEFVDLTPTKSTLGVLGVGDRLPSVRKLAEAAAVNVNTARAVYARLESEGLVRSEHGRGTFVSGEPAGDDAGTRRELRRQIAQLEARLVRLPPPPLAAEGAARVPAARTGRPAVDGEPRGGAGPSARATRRARHPTRRRAREPRAARHRAGRDRGARAVAVAAGDPEPRGARIRWVGA
jgi:GntR family transcriptional regulator